MLADVLGNLRNMCLTIIELDPAKILSAPGLAWQAPLKKTKVKLDLVTDIDVINDRKRDMKKLITNTWKITIKMKNFHVFNIGM